MDYAVVVEGLRDIDLENAPARVKRFAAQAVNYSLRRTRTQAGRVMRQQIAFASRDLVGQNGKLQVARFARADNLEGVIRGNDRPRSLAGFIRGSRRVGRRGVTVEVGTGNRSRMGRAFVMKLKSENIGLAIRLREGERIENKKAMLRAAYSRGGGRRAVAARRASDYNLYLLYGPSVDQVFQTVRDDVSDDAAELMEREFIRLAEALL